MDSMPAKIEFWQSPRLTVGEAPPAAAGEVDGDGVELGASDSRCARCGWTDTRVVSKAIVAQGARDLSLGSRPQYPQAPRSPALDRTAVNAYDQC